MLVNTVQGVAKEIVIQERVVSNEFKVKEINENIEDQVVNVRVELGPFTSEQRPNGVTIQRGMSIRMINVWSGDEYAAIRDTWTNADLIAAIKNKLEQ